MSYELRRIPGEGTLADAHAVRRTVFIEEQGVSEAEEMDGRDEDTTHFVAYAPAGASNRQSDGESDSDQSDETDDRDKSDRGRESDSEPAKRPVGTARLRIPEQGVAKPERVAVLESRRGEGIGRQLMAAIEREAREQGCTRARLHAQTAVEAFYRDLGYETTSDVFEEANIPHVEMEKEL
jgi:predicted GNAT family N-acyltransferase